MKINKIIDFPYFVLFPGVGPIWPISRGRRHGRSPEESAAACFAASWACWEALVQSYLLSHMLIYMFVNLQDTVKCLVGGATPAENHQNL